MNKSCRYNDEFLTFADGWVNGLIKELNIQVPYLDGSIKASDRMVYRNRKEIPSLTASVVFLIDKGEIFKQTVAFEIYFDDEADFAILEERSVWNKKSFAKADTKNIANYIVNRVTSQLVRPSESRILKVK